MLGRLAAVAIVILLMIAGAQAVSASSSDDNMTDFDFNGDTASDDIWTGLCIGSNLDLSRASERNCKSRQEALKQQGPYPYDEPDIEGSLCIGASLDLSRASAARCGRQTRSSGSASRQPEIVETQVVPAAPVFQYAALGDSVAAGAGLPRSANQGDAVCDRSTEAYAYYVAAALGFDFIHVPCTGATMNDLLTRQRVSGPNPPAQLDSAFAGSTTPQLITITAGANDARWDAILLRCLRSTCGTARDTRTIRSALARLQPETHAVLQEIAQRSGSSPPKVIITGYYNPLSANCGTAEPRLSNQELAWVDARLASLNQILQNATASYEFASFVPIDFTGHDICSADPWVQHTGDPAPLHPTAAGQQAIAQMILADP